MSSLSNAPWNGGGKVRLIPYYGERRYGPERGDRPRHREATSTAEGSRSRSLLCENRDWEKLYIQETRECARLRSMLRNYEICFDSVHRDLEHRMAVYWEYEATHDPGAYKERNWQPFDDAGQLFMLQNNLPGDF